jgi:hypothetical protein
MLTISEVWIFNLLQKPLYLGMFFGYAQEGATQEAQFNVKLFSLTHEMCRPRVLLLQVLIFGLWIDPNGFAIIAIGLAGRHGRLLWFVGVGTEE